MTVISNISKKLSELNIVNEYQEHLRFYVNFSNVLKIYEMQLRFLLELDSLASGENSDKIIETYSILKENMIPIKSKENICIPTIALLIEYLEAHILSPLDSEIQKISTGKKNSNEIIKLFEELYIKVRI